MKLEQVIAQLKQNHFLDEREVYVYASVQGVLGGVVGSIKGLVILSVCDELLYIHRANLDNSYGEQMAEIPILDMCRIQGKAGLFGGKFSFEYKGNIYHFKLPSKANKFVDYFTK